MRDGNGAELTRELHPLVCALAGVGERLNLTLQQLVLTTVKYEDLIGEVWWKTPALGKNHKMYDPTLEYKYQYWASSVAGACALGNNAQMHTKNGTPSSSKSTEDTE